MRKKSIHEISFHVKRKERLCFDWIIHEVTKRAKYYRIEIGYAHLYKVQYSSIIYLNTPVNTV